MKSKIDKLELLTLFPYMHENNPVTEVKKQKNFLLVTSEDDSEIWWNYALIDGQISSKELTDIEKYLQSKNRRPSIFISDDKANSPLIEFLKTKKYTLSTQDSWLFWNKPKPSINKENIIKVKTDEEFEEWIKTYKKSYPKDDPKNPYGDQTEFAAALKKSWHERKKSYDQHYLLFENKKPVATAILTNYRDLGYITAVGSIPQVRGKGFGKKISLHCVSESFKRENKCHFLITEEGDYPYEFYKRIGFEPKFMAYLFTKK